MIRSTITFGVLLLAALVASWLDWTAEDSVDLEGQVVVLDGAASAISAVRWIGEETEATLTRRTDERGAYLWVEYNRWTLRKVQPEASDTGGTPEPETERTANKAVFKSADKGQALLDSLSPLAAQRSLEVTEEAKLQDLGLSDPQSRIEIDRGDRTEVIEIGKEAYGTRDYYARHQSSGRIYLLDRELIQPLKYARTRLPDRALFGMARADLESAQVSAGGHSGMWVQRNADDEKQARWAPKENPDAAAEQATTWIDKFIGLKGTQYADPSDPPANLEERFQVALSDGKVTTTITVSQVGPDGDWYASSEYTRGLMKLVRSGASGLGDDVVSLLTDQPGDAP